MTRRLPYTEAGIARIIRAAERQGKVAVLRPDGTFSFEDKNERDNPRDRLEESREVVL